MAQYCRYCSYMCCGDFNYCEIKKRTYSDEHIRHTNHCKDFDLNPIDAIRLNEKCYRPRPKRPEPDGIQITIEELMNDTDQDNGDA